MYHIDQIHRYLIIKSVLWAFIETYQVTSCDFCPAMSSQRLCKGEHLLLALFCGPQSHSKRRLPLPQASSHSGVETTETSQQIASQQHVNAQLSLHHYTQLHYYLKCELNTLGAIKNKNKRHKRNNKNQSVSLVPAGWRSER